MYKYDHFSPNPAPSWTGEIVKESTNFCYSMKNAKHWIIPLVLVVAVLLPGCTADKLAAPASGDCLGTTPTYENDIKEIIDRTCAYSGCHLDSAPGVYTSYTGLQSVLSTGLFRQRVILVKDDPVSGMPPNNAPANRAKNLTAQELNLIQCWLEAGFPEN